MVFVLIRLELYNKWFNEALHWFDAMEAMAKTKSPGRFTYYGPRQSDHIAAAVATSHPEQSLAIYHQNIKQLLTRADQKNYFGIRTYLKMMKPILTKLKRLDQWKSLLNDLRTEYRRRPRFVEVLDALDDRTIVQTEKES